MPTLLSAEDLRILVYPRDHPPIHVHVITKDRSLEVKVDISDAAPIAMRPAKNERMKTTPRHTKRALQLCADNLAMLKRRAADVYYAQ